MKSLPNEKVTLLERMERIEKQNQLLKSYMIFLVIFISALGLMGAKNGIDDGHFRRLFAEEITIVDDTGREIILIGSREGEGTGIRILNKAGKRAVGIGVAPDAEGSGILIADNEGRPRLGLGIDKGVPSIAMVNEEGKKMVGMGGDETGYGLVVMDEKEVERAGVGYREGNTVFAIYDGDGQYVRGMIRQKNGVHYSSYVDEQGKEVIER